MTEDKKYLIKLGKHVESLRTKANLSKAELAEKIEKPRILIYRLEAGENETGILTLRKIAQALEVKLGDLLEV